MGSEKQNKMTIKEKLALETTKPGNEIILHREGVFYIAYERSAWLFFMAVHTFKVKKMYVKCVAQDVVSIGFPMTALERYVTGCKVDEGSGGVRLSLPGDKIPLVDDFEQWKGCQQYATPKQKSETANDDVDEKDIPMSDIIKRIKDFPIECKTPVECMLFLIELKNSCKTL